MEDSRTVESSKKLSEDYSTSSLDSEYRSKILRPRPGLLTAGEWNDLKYWEFWQGLVQDQNENSYFNTVKNWGFKDVKDKLNYRKYYEV